VIDGAMEIGTRAQKDRASGQSGLFADVAGQEPTAARPLPAVPDWTPQEKLTGEKEMLGFYITGHPLDEYADKAVELATHFTSGLDGLQKNTEVALCGILTGIQRKRNKEGKQWAALQVEDKEGSLEAMVFSTQYDRLLPVLNEDKAVLVRGLVLPEENAPPKISVQDARLRLPSLISIRVPVNGAVVNGATDADRAAALSQLFARKPGGTEVRLRIEKRRDFSVILDVPAKVRPDKEFCAELARICGPEALEVLANE
jgi:DNA polymerase-3 subunit alpha